MSVKTASDISLRWAQGQVFNSDKRFRVLVAGRRFGKSYVSCIELLRGAIAKPGETHRMEGVKEVSTKGMDTNQKRI